MYICPLRSSSSGNSTFISSEKDSLLIDVGISGKCLFSALSDINANPGSIKAILVTHDHSDHVKGVGIVARKLNIPIYLTEGSYRSIKRGLGKLEPWQVNIISPNESFFINTMEVCPFKIPHDAFEPVGYRIFTKGCSFALATDIGYFSKTIQTSISGVDVVLLESNHDPFMLKSNNNYPTVLKNRILSKHGHLCNEDCATAAEYMIKNGTKHLILGHLSKENNTAKLAYDTTYNELISNGAILDHDFSLSVAPTDNVGKVYNVNL